jgi:hypothetical protein
MLAQQVAQEENKKVPRQNDEEEVPLQNDEEEVPRQNDEEVRLKNEIRFSKNNFCKELEEFLFKIKSSNKSIDKIKMCSELFTLINEFIIINKGIPKWFFVLLSEKFIHEKFICTTENTPHVEFLLNTLSVTKELLNKYMPN